MIFTKKKLNSAPTESRHHLATTFTKLNGLSRLPLHTKQLRNWQHTLPVSVLELEPGLGRFSLARRLMEAGAGRCLEGGGVIECNQYSVPGGHMNQELIIY